MSRILRYYRITSLFAIVAVAVAMTLVHRELTIRTVEAIAESSNVAMAQLALIPIRPALVGYLEEVGAIGGSQAAKVPLPPELEDGVNELLRNPRVRRIKVYNRNGFVAFSTKPGQAGVYDGTSPQYADAMNGRIAVKLDYHDALNPLAVPSDEENLVESYIPVRNRPGDPVLGVFEIYTDVEPLVRRGERTEMQIVVATLVLFGILYAILDVLVRKAQREIAGYEEAVREKTRLLQELSREGQRREELERKRFARELQEDIAQTLSAVKAAVEGAPVATPPGGIAHTIVPELQSAIRQVRTIATDLRPAGLDELGLVRTVDALLARFESSNPGARVERRYRLRDADVPPHLRIVVYRVIEGALAIVSQREAVTRVGVDLALDDGGFAVTIEDDGAAVALADGAIAGVGASAFSVMRERTVVSGGTFAVSEDATGALRVQAAWPVHA